MSWQRGDAITVGLDDGAQHEVPVGSEDYEVLSELAEILFGDDDESE